MGWNINNMGVLGAFGRLGAVSVIALMSANAWAGTVDANPSLVSKNYFGADGKEVAQELTLTSMDIDVDIDGSYAETTAIIEFSNPTSDRLEGEFVFDMPQGSTLIGYGLDMNGAIRDGVIVEKKKAERTFNDRIRQGVDPGLAEVTRENAFKTRVFPILPGQTRQISVTYITPVSETKPYTLPLSSFTEVGRFDFTATGDVAPDGVALPGKLVAEWNDTGDTATLIAEALPLEGTITIRAKPAPQVDVQRHKSGRSFAAITLPPRSTNADFAPDSIRVFWDTSLSQENASEGARNFLSSVIDDARPYSVELVPFSDGLVAQKPIDLRPQGEELEHFTKQFKYNGATDLSALYAVEAERGRADICFLVTDGRFTLGDFPKGRLPCKLHVISAAKDADKGVLALLAKNGGGQFIDLTTTTPLDAKRWLGQAVRTPTRLTIDGKDQIAQAEWSEDGDKFRLIVPVDPSAKTYRLMIDGETLEGSLPMRNAQGHSGAGASWAGLHLVSERAKGASRDELIDLSRRYSVVGDETSLLVLETIWDYAANQIDLPSNGFTKAEREDYTRLLAEEKADEAEARANRLEKLAVMWSSQNDWYDGKLPKPDARDGEPVPVMSAPPPAPPPPPPPPPAPAPPVASDAGEVRRQQTVTVQSQSRTDNALMEMAEESIVVTGAAASEQDIGADDVGSISIAAWSPERPYLDKAEGLCGDDLQGVYLGERKEYGSVPSFYLELADVMEACGDLKGAIRTALTALELPTSNDDTLTAISKRLIRYGAIDEAIPLLRRVIRNDPTRPQPWRDLALALDRSADTPKISTTVKRARLTEALELFNHVLSNPWDGKYDGIEVISLMEANRVLDRLEKAGGKGALAGETFRRDMPVDLRIVVSWNVDATDMDLWVDEPGGERAMYSHPRTALGGRLSNDMTQGYGPEEYLLKKAAPGTYEIRMDYYGSDIVNPNGAVAIQAEIWRNWGSKTETLRVVDLEFTDDDQDEYLVATVVIGEDD